MTDTPETLDQRLLRIENELQKLDKNRTAVQSLAVSAARAVQTLIATVQTDKARTTAELDAIRTALTSAGAAFISLDLGSQRQGASLALVVEMLQVVGEQMGADLNALTMQRPSARKLVDFLERTDGRSGADQSRIDISAFQNPRPAESYDPRGSVGRTSTPEDVARETEEHFGESDWGDMDIPREIDPLLLDILAGVAGQGGETGERVSIPFEGFRMTMPPLSGDVAQDLDAYKGAIRVTVDSCYDQGLITTEHAALLYKYLDDRMTSQDIDAIPLPPVHVMSLVEQLAAGDVREQVAFKKREEVYLTLIYTAMKLLQGIRGFDAPRKRKPRK